MFVQRADIYFDETFPKKKLTLSPPLENCSQGNRVHVEQQCVSEWDVLWDQRHFDRHFAKHSSLRPFINFDSRDVEFITNLQPDHIVILKAACEQYILRVRFIIIIHNYIPRLWCFKKLPLGNKLMAQVCTLASVWLQKSHK